jgi:Sugar-tranasporters, 12 TM
MTALNVSCTLYCTSYIKLYLCHTYHTLQPFNDYNILLIGRLLGGVATSLLFTVFESWMVCEHLSRGYPSALLSNTFSKLTTGNGLVAVAAGLVANFTTVMFATPLAPFIVACVPLAFVGLLSLRWNENYGDNTVPIGASMQRAWNYMCSGMYLCNTTVQNAIVIVIIVHVLDVIVLLMRDSCIVF